MGYQLTDWKKKMDGRSQLHILSDLPYRMSPVTMRLGGPQSNYANFAKRKKILPLPQVEQ
jgi:hypothetical protein